MQTQPQRPPSPSRDALVSRFLAVRRATEALCRPLATEDYVIQSSPDASPPKWHLAHITWFFENFVLAHFRPRYERFHEGYAFLFNSYYETVGSFFPRLQRGLLSRPTVREVLDFRAHVDAAVGSLAMELDDSRWPDFAARIELGLHHEQQHQELLLTDIKHNFSINPLRLPYAELPVRTGTPGARTGWISHPGGVTAIGTDPDKGFSFDNETPRHRVFLQPYRIATRAVTNGEYLEFIEAGGYRTPDLWLSDGLRTLRERKWEAPLYWEKTGRGWEHYTLGGMRPVDEHAPVCHVSYYEADAYARWRGKRLPTEAEWETAAALHAIEGNFADSGCFQPMPQDGTAFHGDVWQWCASAYLPYPGFRPLPGSLGEYNGKFMSGQMVLRGGSCATPHSHMRTSYRNFFYAPDRWQFMGIRLAE